MGLYNECTDRLGSVEQRAIELPSKEPRRRTTRAKFRFWKRINQACTMRLFCNNRNGSWIFSAASVISFLFSTVNAAKNFWPTVFLYFAQKCAGEEDTFPPAPPPVNG